MPKESVWGQARPTAAPNVWVPPNSLEVHWEKEGGESGDEIVVVHIVDDNNDAQMSLDLDRRAINKLVRDLRRARGAVFGADE